MTELCFAAWIVQPDREGIAVFVSILVTQRTCVPDTQLWDTRPAEASPSMTPSLQGVQVAWLRVLAQRRAVTPRAVVMYHWFGDEFYHRFQTRDFRDFTVLHRGLCCPVKLQIFTKKTEYVNSSN